MGSLMRIVKYLAWLTQFGLSVVAPLLLCVLGSVWLRNRFDVGGWIVVVGIFLGIGGAVSGLWSSLKQINREAKQEDKKDSISFNDHL